MSDAKGLFSQTAYLRWRKEKGLHVIDEAQRFRVLVGALFCSLAVSLVYTFDLFTTEIATSFSLSASDMTTISTVGILFSYFSLPYGFLYNYAGPLPLLVIGIVTGCVGCLGLGLIFDGVIVGNTTTISIFYALLNSCSGLYDAATTVTLSETFPRNRGLVIALAKIMTGLGCSAFSSWSVTLFQDNFVAFTFFVMAVVVAVGVMSCFLVVLPPYSVNGWRRHGKTQEQLKELQALKPYYDTKLAPLRRVCYGYVVALCMIVFFIITSPVLGYVPVSSAARYVVGALTVALCLCHIVPGLPIRCLGGVDEPAEMPPAMPKDVSSEPSVDSAFGGEVESEPRSATTKKHDFADKEQVQSEPYALQGEPTKLRHHTGRTALNEDFADVRDTQDPRYDGDLSDTLKRADLWLILVLFVCQSCLGILVTYNVSTIYVATTGKPRSLRISALYTTFLGVGSAVGRLVMSLFETCIKNQPAMERRPLITVALPLIPLLSVVGGVLMIVLPGKLLLLPCILIYLHEGLFQAIRARIFPSIFECNHGVFYNVNFIATVIGVICFNRLLFGLLIDQQHEMRGYANNEECKSSLCVRTPLIVATCLAAAASLVGAIIHLRYRHFVSGVQDCMDHKELETEPTTMHEQSSVDN